MTEKHLNAIRDSAMQRWPLQEALIIHRIGEVRPGDTIVLVAVWSAHRAAAFDACRFIMEDLKSKAPLWKKETLRNGERWVDSNTPGFSN
jgi:molybdopterin synthase catalytic subunit